MVHNPFTKNTTVNGRLFLKKEELQPIMEVFVGQLRALIGIEDVWKTSELHRGVERVFILR